MYLAILAPIYIAANVYLFIRIMNWIAVWFPLFLRKNHWIVPVVVYSVFALSFLIAFILPQCGLQRLFKIIGNYWLGVLVYIMLIVVTADILRLVCMFILRIDRKRFSAKAHRIVGCVCAFAIIAVSVLGVVNAGIIRVTPYEITVNKRAGTARSIKAVLIADMHLGYNIGVRQMRSMVEKINRENADIVLIAGDIFDNEWEAISKPDEIAKILRGIKSKEGVYACYGNHDIEEPILAGFTFGGKGEKTASTEMESFLTSAGIHVLQDSAVVIDDSYVIYGRADRQRPGRGITKRAEPSELVSGIDMTKPVIVIDHQPHQLDDLAKAGVDVDLCGHTHDGQLFPGNLIIKLFWKNSYGYMKIGDMHNIVTSGVGLFGPNMRVCTKPEICPITINFAS